MRHPHLHVLLLAILAFAVGCESADGPIAADDPSPPTPLFAMEGVAPYAPGTAERTVPAGRGLRPAAHDCEFKVKGSKWELQDDCTTDGTIFIPDGVTLDGKKHTITAVDPAGDTFRGAVVQNGGATAHVRKLVVSAAGEASAC